MMPVNYMNVGAASGIATVGAVENLYGTYLQMHNERPEYKIAPAATTALNYQQQMAMRDLPDSVKAEYLAEQQLGNSQALQSANDRGGALGTVAAINYNNNLGNLKLASMGANYKQANEQSYINALNGYADRQDQAWDMNFYKPYLYKQALANDYMQKGTQNVVGGMAAAAGQQYGGGGWQRTPQKTSQDDFTPYTGGKFSLSDPNATPYVYTIPKDNSISYPKQTLSEAKYGEY